MPQDNMIIDRVKVGTELHRDRAFGVVTDWKIDADAAAIRLADDSKWVLAVQDIETYRSLIELSLNNLKPILLAVDKETRKIGMIFPTMLGTPELNGQTPDGRQIQISVPPSPRVFRLRKDRTWFDAVIIAVTHTQNIRDPEQPQKFWIAYDPVTSEIVGVRPAANSLARR